MGNRQSGRNFEKTSSGLKGQGTPRKAKRSNLPGTNISLSELESRSELCVERENRQQAHDQACEVLREKLRSTFRKNCRFGDDAPPDLSSREPLLSFAQFDNALQVFEDLGLVRLRGTTIGARLYSVLACAQSAPPCRGSAGRSPRSVPCWELEGISHCSASQTSINSKTPDNRFTPNGSVTCGHDVALDGESLMDVKCFLDKQKGVTEKDFVDVLSDLITGHSDSRARLTLRVYGVHDEKDVRSEFVLGLLCESWKAAYRILSAEIQEAAIAEGISASVSESVRNFGERSIELFKDCAKRSFREVDAQCDVRFTPAQLLHWAAANRFITVQFNDAVSVRVPLSFLNLNAI